MSIKCEHGIIISKSFNCSSCIEWIENFELLMKDFKERFFTDKNFKKKLEMKKFHCAHCGKSTIVEI